VKNRKRASSLSLETAVSLDQNTDKEEENVAQLDRQSRQGEKLQRNEHIANIADITTETSQPSATTTTTTTHVIIPSRPAKLF
jgi:hypothetical protein